jgi:uncharacterized membrane protein YedE/YeeE
VESEPKFRNPYLAGIGLGLVLLASFIVMGRGLGASGAAYRVGVKLLDVVSHERVALHPYFGSAVKDGVDPLRDPLVFLMVGVVLGALVSAYGSGRFGKRVVRGPRIGVRARIALAIAGGVIMGFAARLSLGCTSGQALTGGALMSAGSFLFMLAVFAGGYAVAWFVRRQWT